MNRSFFALGIALAALSACSHPTPLVKNTPQPVVENTPVVAEAKPTLQPARAAASTTTAPPPQAVKSAPTQARMTPAERESLDKHLARLADALFDYDRASIRPDAITVLRADVDVIRDLLTNYPAETLLIEGHADDRGSSEYNLALGDKRADTVRDFLASLGVPKAQLSVRSFGKDRPVCAEETEDCWQRNRRVHIATVK